MVDLLLLLQQDLLLLLQQAPAEEAEEWTGERQGTEEWTGEREGKEEEVPLKVRAPHTWTDAGSTETRNVDQDGTQARASGGRKEGRSDHQRGSIGWRTRNGSKNFLEAIPEKEDLVFGECRGERERK